MSGRLNLGCGPIVRGEWINFDREVGRAGVYLGDMRALPFGDGEFGIVVANHSLQQVPLDDLTKVMSEVHRVLWTGGVFRVIIPDIVAAFDAYRREDLDWFPNRQDRGTLDEVFSGYLTWYGTNITPITGPLLTGLFRRAGFFVCESEHKRTCSGHPEATDLDDRQNESIFMEGIKP